MSWLRNEKEHGVWLSDGRETIGPKLSTSEELAKRGPQTPQEKYDMGLITLRELGIMNRSFEEIESMQGGKLK